MADLGEGRPLFPPPPTLFWVQKEEMTERRKVGRASKSNPSPPSPLALDLDLPMDSAQNSSNKCN